MDDDALDLCRTMKAKIAPMKRILTLLAIAAALTSAASTAAAQTRAFDAKALARYDLSYAKCESLFPDMLGHRDEAYLNLWRIRSDDKSAARLAGVRSGAAGTSSFCSKSSHSWVVRSLNVSPSNRYTVSI